MEILVHILSYSEISHYAIVRCLRKDLMNDTNIIPYLWYELKDLTDSNKPYVRKLILPDLYDTIDIARQITHVKAQFLPLTSRNFDNITHAYVTNIYYGADNSRKYLRHIQCDYIDFEVEKINRIHPFGSITSLYLRKAALDIRELRKFRSVKRLKADLTVPLTYKVASITSVDYWEGSFDSLNIVSNLSAKKVVERKIVPRSSLCIVS